MKRLLLLLSALLLASSLCEARKLPKETLGNVNPGFMTIRIKE